MVLHGTLMRAVDLLDEEESKHVNDTLMATGENDPGKMLETVAYIFKRVPELDSLMDAAYEEVMALAIQTWEKGREKKFDDAERTAEAAGDLLGIFKDGAEAAEVDVPGFSAVGIGVDLLFDPARFRRSARERQKRFFKNAAILCCKAMSGVWVGVLLFAIFHALERYHVISSLPRGIRMAVPDWFEQLSIGGQMLLLVLLAVGFVLVGLIVVYLAARAGVSPRLTPLFKLKVTDEDLASTVLKSLFLPSQFPKGVPQDTLWKSCTAVYKSVYLHSGKPNSDDLKILEEILKGGNENAAAAFLKWKIRNYRLALQNEAEQFCRNAADVMQMVK